VSMRCSARISWEHDLHVSVWLIEFYVTDSKSCWNKISFRSEPGYRCMATLPHGLAIRKKRSANRALVSSDH
jgi:hypothetical protein